MADNTILNAGAGGDTIRDLARGGGTVKTQVVALDLGGPSQNAENLVTAGQQTSAKSVPVVVASDQSTLPISEAGASAVAGASLPSGGAGLTGWLSAIWKTLQTGLARTWTLSSSTDSVDVGNFPATQAVSAASLPLPSGAATAANQPALNADGGALAHVTNFPVTQAVSAAALPLPSNAAQESGGNLAAITASVVNTAAGVSDTTALGVQGVTGGVPLPISQINGALETGGNLAAAAATLAASQSYDSPSYAVLTGDPNGDFAGVPLVEKLMDPASGEAANVRIINPPLQDQRGAQVASDAPAPIVWYGGAIGPGPLIDTTGYNSVVVSFSGANGSYYFQTSNDPEQFTATLANAAGWSAAGGSLPVVSAAAAAGANYVFPVTGRYFRPYCYAAGPAGANSIHVRSAAAQQLASTPSISIGQIFGSNLPAVAVTANAYPLPIGGADQGGLTRHVLTDSNGSTINAGALAPNWSFGVYNVNYSPYTSAASSLSAALSTINPIVVGGGDVTGRAQRLLTAQNGAARIDHEQPTAIGASVAELLTQLLAVERARLFIEMECARLDHGIADDPDMLVNEFLTSALPN